MSHDDPLIVLGAGAAGLAAAWSARRAGRAVTIVDGGVGASGLGGGALDLSPWDSLLGASEMLPGNLQNEELPADLYEMSDDVGLWKLPRVEDPVPLLATAAGRIRTARGYDRALLDLGSLLNTRVLVVDVERPEWSARSLARTLGADPIARERQIAFDAVAVPICRFVEERSCTDADLARQHDEDDRLAWLGDRLRAAVRHESAGGHPIGAVLIGPWLGAKRPRAEAVSAAVGVPIGEVMATMSTAGHRFEAARDRWLERAGVQVLRRRIVALRSQAPGVIVELEGGVELRATALVVAVGGMAGGGIVYTRPDPEGRTDTTARSARLPFQLSLDADLPLASSAITGSNWSGPPPYPLDIASTLHGPELDRTAWPTANEPGALESVGLWARGVEVKPGILAAGDVLAARPRTMLAAIATGLAAGRVRGA